MFPEADFVRFLAAFTRVASWTAVGPVVGERTVPARVKLAVAGAVALMLMPLRSETQFSELGLVLPREILFGIFIGAAGRMVMAAAETAGQLIGLELGLGFAGIFDPMAGEQALPTRRLVLAFASLAFLGLGGLESAIWMLSLSLEPALEGSLAALIGLAVETLGAALRLVAPLMIAAFIANITMAVVSKAAPALNPFSVMLALLLVVGLWMLLGLAPATIRELMTIARNAMEAPSRVMSP